jgi:vaccinia related kinase
VLFIRFLVIDKLGSDLDKTFGHGAHPLALGTLASIAVQVLHCLQYIHSRGYTHNDVKAANLLQVKLPARSVTSLQGPGPGDWYLVDFGLAVKYLKGDPAVHKEFKPDPRKMHDGTIEYLSR